MKKVALAILGATLVLAACKHRTPSAVVIVIDTSSSITPRAEHDALAAVGDRIARMERGDRLVVIPITTDARNDAQGRILRLEASTVRQAYDADLTRFRTEARQQFNAWAAAFDARQSRTDILGALDAARQELAAMPNNSARRLVVVSDFLEDDGVYDFVRDRALANPARARALADRIRLKRNFAPPDTALCLGRLESRDFAPLTESRKAAVEAFWQAYLAGSGTKPALHFDGTGLLKDADHGCIAAH